MGSSAWVLVLVLAAGVLDRGRASASCAAGQYSPDDLNCALCGAGQYASAGSTSCLGSSCGTESWHACTEATFTHVQDGAWSRVDFGDAVRTGDLTVELETLSGTFGSYDGRTRVEKCDGSFVELRATGTTRKAQGTGAAAARLLRGWTVTVPAPDEDGGGYWITALEVQTLAWGTSGSGTIRVCNVKSPCHAQLEALGPSSTLANPCEDEVALDSVAASFEFCGGQSDGFAGRVSSAETVSSDVATAQNSCAKKAALAKQTYFCLTKTGSDTKCVIFDDGSAGASDDYKSSWDSLATNAADKCPDNVGDSSHCAVYSVAAPANVHYTYKFCAVDGTDSSSNSHKNAYSTELIVPSGVVSAALVTETGGLRLMDSKAGYTAKACAWETARRGYTHFCMQAPSDAATRTGDQALCMIYTTGAGLARHINTDLPGDTADCTSDPDNAGAKDSNNNPLGGDFRCAVYEVTFQNSKAPTPMPTAAPSSAAPSVAPTAAPTAAPISNAPTVGPTSSPTSEAPTASPSSSPTSSPASGAPTRSPTRAPTPSPTPSPTPFPTHTGETWFPSAAPTSDAPSVSPTAAPESKSPTAAPTKTGETYEPSRAPLVAGASHVPTASPSPSPTRTAEPTAAPASGVPTAAPQSGVPTAAPVSVSPTAAPTPACVAGEFLDGATCTACAEGRYCPSQPCEACLDCNAPGHVTNAETAASTCTACAAGQYFMNTYTCAHCPAGHITNRLALTGATACTACPAGRWSAVATVACAACPAGSVTDKLGAAGAKSCTPCHAGKFSSISTTACEDCAAGSVTTNLATTSDVCSLVGNICPDGSAMKSGPGGTGQVCAFHDEGRRRRLLSTPSKFPTIPGESYVPTAAPASMSPTAAPTAAPTASPTSNAPTSAPTEGWTCPTGCIRTHDGASPYCMTAPIGSTTCDACAAGHYSPSSSIACITCNAGHVTDTLGSTGARMCNPCAAGRSSAASTDACTDCVAGTYGAAPGLASCVSCPDGHFSDQPQRHKCHDVGAGKQGQTSGSTGYPYEKSGATHQVACVAGKFNTDGDGACQACGNGEYSPVPGLASCLDVPDGMQGEDNAGNFVDASSLTDGASGATKAVACANGKYNTNGDGACTDVAAGNQGVDGSGHYIATGAVAEDECVDGTYNVDGDGACQDVADGKQGQTSGTVGGTYVLSGATHEVACADGTYNTDGTGACQDVAPGKQGQSANNNVGGAHATKGAIYAVDCADGKYNSDGIGACADVDDGKQGQSANDDVGGAHATTGAIYAVNCASGKYNTDGTGACVDIPNGWECATAVGGITDSSDGCITVADCDPGSFRDGTADTTTNQCKGCPANWYQDQVGQKACKDIANGKQGQGPDDTAVGGAYLSPSATTQVNCAQGKYNADGNGECSICVAGKFQDEKGEAECKGCPIGKFQTADAQSSCDDCAAGHVTMVNSAVVAFEATACVACDAGTFTTAPSVPCAACIQGRFATSSASTGCDTCAPGGITLMPCTTAESSICEWKISTSKATRCALCPAGQFTQTMTDVHTGCRTIPAKNRCASLSSGGTVGPASIGCTAVTLCPGHTNAAAGTNLCATCPAGQVQQSGGTGCDMCDAGKFSVAPSLPCTSCGPGKYAAGAGSTDCSTCAAGHYTNTLSVAGATSCTACGAGKYSSSSTVACAAIHDGRRCASLSAGSVVVAPSSTGCKAVEACPPGEYFAAGGVVRTENLCKSCPGGHVTDSLAAHGGTTCTECTVGKSSPVSTSACEDCPNGQFQDGTAATSCKDVDDGKQAVDNNDVYVAAGAYGQATCAAGKYNTNGDGECQEIPDGHKCDSIVNGGSINDVSTGCFGIDECPAGKIRDASTSSDTNTCVMCVDGKFQDAPGKVMCKDVANGKQGQADDTVGAAHVANGATNQAACKIGSYSTNGDGACTRCATGFYGGATGLSACLAIPDGHKCIAVVGGVSVVSHSTGCTDIGACIAGTARDFWGSADNLCTLCATGLYQDEVGKKLCKDIENGKQGQTSKAGVVYAASGATHQVLCRFGKYTEDGDGACVAIPDGKKCATIVGGGPVEATSKGCTTVEDCVVGTSRDAAAISNLCRACTYKKYQDAAGQDSCKPVDNGKQGQAGSSAVGETCVLSGATAQVDCPQGKHTNNAADKHLGQCVVCAIGQFQDEEGESTCKPIGPGKQGQERPGGAKYANSGARYAVPCAPSKYSKEGYGRCRNCAPGSLASAGAGTRGSTKCRFCPNGQFSESSKMQCTNCPYAYISASPYGATRCKSCKSYQTDPTEIWRPFCSPLGSVDGVPCSSGATECVLVNDRF